MDPTELLQMLNEFYTNAFSQLITLAIAIFGLGGVIVPLVYNIFQNRSLKNEQKILENQLQESLRQLKVEILEDIEKKFEIEKNIIQQQTLEQTEKANGLSYFQQAIRCTNEKNFITAAQSYCWAIKCLINGKDEVNTRRAINNLIDSVLPYLNHENYEDEENLSTELNELISKLESLNTGNKYFDDITIVNKLVKTGKTKKIKTTKTTG